MTKPVTSWTKAAPNTTTWSKPANIKTAWSKSSTPTSNWSNPVGVDTSWIANPNYSPNAYAYDSASHTYDSSTDTYDGVVAGQNPNSTAPTTDWITT